MELLVLYGLVFFLGLLVVALAVGLYLSRTEQATDTDITAEILLNTFDEPLLVLDGDHRVLGANLAFRSTFHEDPVAHSLAEIFRDDPDVQEAIVEQEPHKLTITEGDHSRHLELSHHIGGGTLPDETRQVVYFHDETAHAEQVADLQGRNERLDEFASMLSHDLRNPLDVAIGRTNAVREHVEDPELEFQLQKAAEAHGRILQIINDLLSLAREGQEIGDLEPVALDETAVEAWEHVDTGTATLAVETTMGLQADCEHLERVLENLFRNAVEYGGESVTVTVGALEADDGFYVGDDGPGIPADRREEVFQAGFSRGEDGTGLGLAIVEQIATAHGWEIGLTETETGGARFEFHGVEPVADEDVPVR